MVNHMVKSDLDRVFHALSHGARRTMLDRLSHGPATVGDLARPLSMSAPAVSKHLRVLEDAGLVTRRRQGRMHRIQVRADHLASAQSWLEQRAALWKSAFDELERMLKEEPDDDRLPG